MNCVILLYFPHLANSVWYDCETVLISIVSPFIAEGHFSYPINVSCRTKGYYLGASFSLPKTISLTNLKIYYQDLIISISDYTIIFGYLFISYRKYLFSYRKPSIF